MIPHIIHQTWKTNTVPKKWQSFTRKVRKLNPDWSYRLWSDDDNDAFVKEEFPDFYPVFSDFPKGIMRADVIRYLIMYKMGGVYLDLDYEMLAPFDFGEHEIVLPLNNCPQSGGTRDELGNCIFASEPGHPFWKDVIDELKNNPPVIKNYHGVVNATGPGLLTRIYYEKNYQHLYTPARMLYHPPSPHRRRDTVNIKKNGVSLGIHHPWGSWKERWTTAYWKAKAKKKYARIKTRRKSKVKEKIPT